MRSRRFWIGALAFHFLFIGAVSCWDILDLVDNRRTMLPEAFVAPARQLAQAMQSVSPRQLARSNPVHQAIIGYGHITGVESPYTFFAPNVPESLRVVFEIQLPNNRLVYDVPHVQSRTDGLRLSALIDQATAQPGLWRDIVLQMLAASVADMNPVCTKQTRMTSAKSLDRRRGR